MISCGVRRCGLSTGNKTVPSDFAGSSDFAAGSFRRGWPVRFAPAADSVGAAKSVAGAVIAGATISEAGANCEGGAESAGGTALIAGNF